MTKIRAKYNPSTKTITGYFPKNINYPNNVIDIENKTIDGEPYIEISSDEYKQIHSKQMIVENDSAVEFKKSDSEILSEAKKAKCLEINKLRDEKIIEDSTRYTEAETANTAIEALTTIEDVDGFDVDGSFS